jgi:hypothetical protein
LSARSGECAALYACAAGNPVKIFLNNPRISRILERCRARYQLVPGRNELRALKTARSNAFAQVYGLEDQALILDRFLMARTCPS